jgi:hypothetical protein
MCIVYNTSTRAAQETVFLCCCFQLSPCKYYSLRNCYSVTAFVWLLLSLSLPSKGFTYHNIIFFSTNAPLCGTKHACSRISGWIIRAPNVLCRVKTSPPPFNVMPFHLIDIVQGKLKDVVTSYAWLSTDTAASYLSLGVGGNNGQLIVGDIETFISEVPCSNLSYSDWWFSGLP